MVKGEKIRYQLSKQSFDNILATGKNGKKKADAYQYVMDFINEQYGLKGTVTQLSVI